jgi:hypothetical protein
MSEQAKNSQHPTDIYFFATCVVDQFYQAPVSTPLLCLNVKASVSIFRKNKPAAVNPHIRAVFLMRRARSRRIN